MKLAQVIALHKKAKGMMPTIIAQLACCQSLTKYLNRFYAKDLFYA